MGRCKSLGSLKWSLWHSRRLSGASILCFPILSPLGVNQCWVFFCCLLAKSCPTLCDPMDCSLPGSSIHKIFQARILEWVTISFSRGSSQPRDQTWVSLTEARLFTVWATREVISLCNPLLHWIWAWTCDLLWPVQTFENMTHEEAWTVHFQ